MNFPHPLSNPSPAPRGLMVGSSLFPHYTTVMVAKPSMTVKQENKATTTVFNMQDLTLFIDKTVCSWTKRQIVHINKWRLHHLLQMMVVYHH